MNNDQFFNMMMSQRSNSLLQNDIRSENANTNHENVFINFLNNKYKESPEMKQQIKDTQVSPMIAGPKTNKFEPYILKPSNQITQIQNGAKVDYLQNNPDNNIKNSISSVFMTGNSQQQFSELQYSKLSSDLNQLIKGKAVQNNFKQSQNLNNSNNVNTNNNFRSSNLRDSSKEFKFSEINIENLNDNEIKLFSNVPSTLWDSLEDNHNLLMNKRNKPEASTKSKYKDYNSKVKDTKENLNDKKKTDPISNLKDHQAIPMNFHVKNQNFKLEVNDSNDLNDDKFNIFNDENNAKDFFPQEYLNDRRGSLNNLHPFIYKMNKKESIDYFNNVNQQNYLKFPPKASFNNSELRDSIVYQDHEKSDETLNLQENSVSEDKEDTNVDADRVDAMKGCGLSREMKMLKNRISAKKCREKKKKEREVMEDENDKLKKEVESLKNEMAFYNLTSKMKTVSYLNNFFITIKKYLTKLT